MTTKDKNFFWLANLAFYGLVGMAFCWLPVILGAIKAVNNDTPLKETIQWEWESWLVAIQEAVGR